MKTAPVKSLPPISVVIPIYNGEEPLKKCLASLRDQDYPRNRIELIVVDDDSTDSSVKVASAFKAKIVRNGARHIEKGKALGIRAAKNEFILFLDADNYFPDKNWLKNAALALLEDKQLVGVESARFNYRQSDPAANRYCALFGVNDPLAFYLNKRDRLAVWEEDWRLAGNVVANRPTYWKIKASPETMPTIGSQGYLTRKSLIQKAGHWPYFFHMDATLELVRKGHCHFGMLKQPIGHDHCSTPAGFLKKCARNLDLFFKYREHRQYTWETPKPLFALAVLSMVTLVRPFIDAYRAYARKEDPAVFLHPLFCFLVPLLYGIRTIRQFLGSNKIRPPHPGQESLAHAGAKAGKGAASRQNAGYGLSLRPGFSTAWALGLGMLLIIGLWVWHRHGAHSPADNATAAVPVAEAPESIQNGSPAAKNETLENLATLKKAIRKYRGQNDGKAPVNLEADLKGSITAFPIEAISNSATVVTRFDGKGGWLYCPKVGKVSVNLPDLLEVANPSSQGFYALNHNLRDGSGNGRNGWYMGQRFKYFGNSPFAWLGGASIGGASDASYIGIPPSVFTDGMRTTGAIKHSVFVRNEKDEFKVSIGSNHGASGDFYALWNPKGQIRVRIPTTGGFRDCDSAENVYEGGKWYTLYVYWNPKGFKVDLKDEKAGTFKTIIAQDPMADVRPDFAPPSVVVIGGHSFYNEPDYLKFCWQGFLANIAFFDSIVTAESDHAPAASGCQ